ncbi:splicing factor yju2 [Holotrichia oblita]|uniref:Splicing factor yju2 n=1 Tax=Holotrichia oblita TaxID=644536 RepID=A0ACB9SV77_HOLOL|nr:splicing factor yju2 [Holotrichia oblita]
MKCHLCDNHFIIKTDPANLDYVILSGARRQENRWDPTKNEQIVPETKEVQKRLFDDSMFKLEHESEDKVTAESAKPRLAKLFSRNESAWSDVYTANQKLREAFRKKSAEIKHKAATDKSILNKYSLNIPLLPEREEDKRAASILSLKLKPAVDITENTELTRKRIISQSSLPSNFTPITEKKALKILNKDHTKTLGVIRRNDKQENNDCNKKIKLENQESDTCSSNMKPQCSLVGDYGSSSESDS